MKNNNNQSILTALNDAVYNGETINIQMDVTKDWNNVDLKVIPQYITEADDYIVINTDIGSITIDTLHVGYDIEDGCFVCMGVDSSVYIYC